MKADEIAHGILSDTQGKDDDGKLDVVLRYVIQLWSEQGRIIANRATRISAQSALGLVRESFSKWKGVVARVKKADPEFFIREDFFPLYLMMTDMNGFMILYRAKAFLGCAWRDQELTLIKEYELHEQREVFAEKLHQQIRDMFNGWTSYGPAPEDPTQDFDDPLDGGSL